MKFQDDIDFTTLSWIKTELDATLQQARVALEAYVENPSNAEQMHACMNHLHLVHGTLRMVELYGAALVVEEMERVAQGLAEGTIPKGEDVYSVLMRGIVQLPDYLERLQSGHKDIPIILLPLLNDLRAARGEKLLSESVLFTPDLSATLPPPESTQTLSLADLRAESLRLRNGYQVALLRWIRDQGSANQLSRMADVLDRLYAVSSVDDARRLWWVANGVLDGVRAGSIVASVAIKLLFAKIDREIKRLVDDGEAAFIKTPPRDLTKNFLYYLAHASVETPRATAIRQLYNLDSLLPSAQELEHAHGSISGHNRALLDTVAAAIKDDLLHVKEALDIFLRTQDSNPAELEAQTGMLDRVADTLGMLGLGVPRRLVVEQRAIVADIASGQRPADEASLLDVAGSLLYVEASLDDHIVRLGVDNLAEGAPAVGFELPRAEVSRILDALMREASANIAQTKYDIVAFVEAPWDHGRVEETPRLLEEVSGALDMLSLHDAAQLIIGIVRFVEIELLQHRRVPNHEQMDTLADALASVEYYIEATREHRAGRERILEITRGRLRALNYWPLPAAPTQRPATLADAFPKWEEPTAGKPTAETSAPSAPIAPAPAQQAPVTAAREIIPLVAPAVAAPIAPPAPAPSVAVPAASTPVAPAEVEETYEEEVPDADAVNHGVDFGFSTDPAQTLDSEIRDIFLEEVDEEIGNLRTNLPLWRHEPNDFERLKTIRRSFHTLKGSGRLVGAQALGDFSWKVENMLNRVLDKTIVPSDAVQLLVGHAVDALPDLAAALRGAGAPAVDILAIKDVADRVAAGDEAFVNEITLRPRKLVTRTRRTLRDRGEVPMSSVAVERGFDAAPSSSGREALPQLDPLLFEVLRTEVTAHLGVIDAFVADAQVAPTQVTPALLRATHTLNGAIAMVDLPQISQALMPLESYVKRLQAWEQAPDAEGVAALGETSSLVKAAVAALEGSSNQIPDFSALIQRIVELRDALPEPELLHSLLAAEDEPDLDAAESASDAHGTDVDSAPAPVAEAPVRTLTVQQSADEDAIAAALAALADAQAEPLIPVHDAFDRAAVAASAAELRSVVPATPTPADVVESEPYVTEDATSVSVVTSETEPSTYLDADANELAAAHGDFASAQTTEHDFEATEAVEAASFETASFEAAATEPAASEPVPIEVIPVEVVPAESSLAETIVLESTPIEAAAPDAAPVESSPIESSPIESATADSTPAQPEFAQAQAGRSVHDEPTQLQSAPDEPVHTFDVVESTAADHVAATDSTAAAPAEASGPLYPVPQIDEDLLEIFVQEAQEILDHADALMARLRETPEDRELISGLQRDLHTVKGGAHMSGLIPIGDLGHAMESLLEAVSEQRRDMSGAVVEALEAGFDRLHGLVLLVARRQPSTMPVALIGRVERLVIGDPEPAAAAAEAAAEIAAPAAQVTDLAKPSAESLPASPVAPIPAVIPDDAEARTTTEHIRVRADLLDSMVNTAGEVAIYRSRLEQQIAGYRFNLAEFDGTVTRLREQLRKLELETEAQILSRYQRADEAGLSTFDPLELDRFSQLQQLSRSLSESVSDLSSIQGTFDELTRQSETLLLQQSRVNSDLQEGLMRTRMVPFESLVPALRRTLRQSAMELGKRAQLKVEGAQGEMDRNLLERMKAPFEHMLRNALAHGIETPDERIAVNKLPDGSVNIALSREATEVVLRVTDDGRGLDREAIRRKAIERGIIKDGATISDRDLYACILDSGFSTAESVTQLAGRGVGMDVVNNEIKLLGGSLAIDSTPGIGASFTVRLPFTLAVTQAILVRLGDASYAIPMTAVQGVVRIARDDLQQRVAAPDPSYAYAGETFMIHDLAHLLGVHASAATDDTQVPLLMTRSGDQRAAVRVDAVLGSREIVVKSVGPQISSVPGILGATIMGDGSVVMILDLAPLLRRAASLRVLGEDGLATAPPPPLPAPPPQKRRLLVMVVDDSITMRKATSRVLERQDIDVVTAKDGLDAVEKLQDHIPDLVVLDIEMPRMDGYEFATYMKNDPRTRGVPIIMVTSRTGEKHRQRAQEIGVERYLGKPYQEAELLQNIREALGAKS